MSIATDVGIAGAKAGTLAMLEEVAESAAGMEEMLRYAHLHREVIERFGRFPHRNSILGRASTAEELSFLEQPGSRF